MDQVNSKVKFLLQVGVAGCFIGHGVFGLLKKTQWLVFFNWAGIDVDTAYNIMPVIGLMDISLGLLVLVRPYRWVLVWMVFWALFTAFLRPVLGLSIFEFFERAGNYGVPLALLAMTASQDSFKDDGKRILVWSTAFLMIGHGGLAVSGKQILLDHWQFLRIADPLRFVPIMGWFEIVVGVWVGLRPQVSILLFIFFWKVFTESLYPLAGAPIWEFIERFGSYVAPLAIAIGILKPKNLSH